MIRRFLFIGALFFAGFTIGCGKEAGEQPKDVEAGPTKVKLETSMGDIVLELQEQVAPGTVKNFIRYVEEGFYDGIIFHRVVRNFMIQGGGFTVDLRQKQTHPMIDNEFKLSNIRGTVAMAKLGGNPDSATSQFFINVIDNIRLDGTNGGFTVFGKVVEGMDVVDAIAAVKTIRKSRRFTHLPVKPVVIRSARVISGK